MLQLFKNPEDYINYGVWLIPNGRDYPEKRKITEVRVRIANFQMRKYVVESVKVVRDENWYTPNLLFMSKRECMKNRREHLKRRLKAQEVNLDTYQRSVEIATEDIERIKRELEKLK